MSLLLLRDSLARSKTKWKRWMNTGSKRAATVAATAGQSVWPGITSLLSQLESTTDMFSPLKLAIEGLSRLVETYERVSGKQSEFIELRERINKILEDISAHIESPADSIMTKSVRLICLDIETEVNITERKQGYQTGRRFLDAMVEQDEVIDCCRRVHAHLERLTLNLNLGIMKGVNEQVLENRLARISPSMSASYNSAESDTIKRRSCTPGTRQPQIDMLLEWARTPDSGKTCWMNGMAGTGKTTIAYTVCSQLERDCQLGASFFCSRTIPGCRQVKYIIPTIAYQLARFSLPFRCALAKALERDPDAHTRALSMQYQKLIAEPLTEVQQSLPADFIVVIDALDECEGEDNVSQIMNQLLSTTDTIPIRFLISSRPEKQIAHRMAGRLSEHEDTRVVLHALDRSTVRTDIEAYMRAELKDVPLSDTQWPLIVDCCGELFIYASTVCRYVKNAHENRSLNEAVVVVTSSGSGPETENMIDDLYSTVLDAANNSTEMNNTDKERMNEVLQTVVCAMEPMCVDVIASLLRLDSGDRVYRLLAPLRSVLNVTKGTGMVTTLHASFADFMLSTGRSAKFHCQPSIRHTKMAEACLQVIEASKRKFNVCALPSSYLLDHEVEGLEEKKSQSISAVDTP